MRNRATEDHKIWLFDLAHGNLSEVQIVQGFLKFYALNGLVLGNIQDDLLFKTRYGKSYVEQAMERLTSALEKAAGGELMDRCQDGSENAAGSEETDV